MNIKIKYACVIIFALYLLVRQLPLFPFVPVFNTMEKWRDQEWRRMSYNLNDHEILALRRVLSDAGETYFYLRAMHKVLIPFRLFVDTEMLGNYTAKAGLRCPNLDFEINDHGLWIKKTREMNLDESVSRFMSTMQSTFDSTMPHGLKQYTEIQERSADSASLREPTYDGDGNVMHDKILSD